MSEKSSRLDIWQFLIDAKSAQTSGKSLQACTTTGADLPMVTVQDANGASAGFVIGFAIDIACKVELSGAWRAGLALPDDPNAFVQHVLYALGGRFAFVLDYGGAARIYPDCNAQVPCVFDPEKGLVASTAHAIFDSAEYDVRFDAALFRKLGVDGEGWFPGGLTAHTGVHRILAAHYLDLHTWQVRRFYPFKGVPVTKDPDGVLDDLIDNVRAQIEALVPGPRRVAMALTGGYETRMLLACAKPWIDQIDFVTVSAGDRHKMDTVLARRIAKTMGLNHIELIRTSATPKQRAQFIRRGGHCNADSNSYYHPSVWPIRDSHVFVGGLGGEVARAFLWHPEDTPQSQITTGVLCNRLGLPRLPELVERFEHWFAELPPLDAYQILDHAYIEQRCSAWYAVQFCSDPGLVRHAPLFNYTALDLLLALPPDWKRRNQMSHQVIAKLWPELHGFPYNSLGWVSDTLLKLRRVAADPRIAIKKLRKMRG